MGSRNVIIAGAGTGVGYRLLSSIYEYLCEFEPVIAIDCGRRYKRITDEIGPLGMYHHVTETSDIGELKSGMVTVYDLEDILASSSNQLCTVLTDLVNMLLGQDTFPDLIIDEAWIFHNTDQLSRLINEYPGNIELVLQEVEDFELFGLDPNIYDSYSFHPSWSSDLKSKILKTFGHEWEIITEAVKRCGINRTVNGFIETIRVGRDRTFKREIFRANKAVDMCIGSLPCAMFD